MRIITARNMDINYFFCHKLLECKTLDKVRCPDSLRRHRESAVQMDPPERQQADIGRYFILDLICTIIIFNIQLRNHNVSYTIFVN